MLLLKCTCVPFCLAASSGGEPGRGGARPEAEDQGPEQTVGQDHGPAARQQLPLRGVGQDTGRKGPDGLCRRADQEEDE